MGNPRTGLLIASALAALFATATIVLAIVLATRFNADSRRCDHPYDWRQSVCCEQKCAKSWDPKPMILVSLDGFRADYLRRNRTLALQRLVDCGVHSPYMYSCYPTKTFPNHYSIVTGLYPESHGIVDNSMYDRNITPAKDRLFGLAFPSSKNPQWWFGEPFWNTVQKSNKISGTFFWPGSEVEIQGMRPTYWEKYDGKVPFTTRVDTVVQWLLKPEGQRPDFITLYFNQPDHYGHKFGPDSNEVNDELIVVDWLINDLMTQLFQNQLLHCVNIIVVSDHGMQATHGTDIVLDQYFDSTGMLIFPGPVARVMLENSSSSAADVMKTVLCKNESFRTYERDKMPNRLHYSRSPRIGDLVVDSDLGYYVSGHKKWHPIGQHGYDFRFRNMHALFIGQGPSFKQGYAAEPFENIELYNLMADLLKIPQENRAPNNGTQGSLNPLLRAPQLLPQSTYKLAKSCNIDLKKIKSCGTCQQKEAAEFRPLASTISMVSNGAELCRIRTGTYSLLYHKTLKTPYLVEGLLTSFDNVLPPPNCYQIQSDWTTCAQVEQMQEILTQNDMVLAPLYTFGQQDSTKLQLSLLYQRSPMKKKFYEGVWLSALNLARNYAKKFGTLMVASGPIFDFDHDGLADSEGVIKDRTKLGFLPIPSSFYLILLRCDKAGGGWPCPLPYQSQVLSFVLPHQDKPTNCQSTTAYLYSHTGRVRDIELLTGLELLTNRTLWDAVSALRLRTHINQRLW